MTTEAIWTILLVMPTGIAELKKYTRPIPNSAMTSKCPMIQRYIIRNILKQPQVPCILRLFADAQIIHKLG